MSTAPSTLAPALLQLPIPDEPLGQALLLLVVLAVVIVVGRFVLSIAWKLVLIASVVVGALWVVTTFL
jgi:hypothetical protein